MKTGNENVVLVSLPRPFELQSNALPLSYHPSSNKLGKNVEASYINHV